MKSAIAYFIALMVAVVAQEVQFGNPIEKLVLLQRHAEAKINTSTQTEQSSLVSALGACEQFCRDEEYPCIACSNRGPNHVSITKCASTWGKPSCAMGCFIGSLSTNVNDCKKECEQSNGKCNWDFRGTMMNNCGPAASCPGQDRGKASWEECKEGCEQMFVPGIPNQNGPRMTGQAALDEANAIRRANGITKPMTYYSAGEACANKAAEYNSKHGSHRCGKDGVCQNCFDGAAGDFNANDKVDAIDRAYESRWHEGPNQRIGTCDETSHCGALLIYNKIAVGVYEPGAYYVVFYYK